MSIISYRPEIDGLRALAVLSVLFYHAGLEYISGGYVGVDIFFVISGFLITSIINSELQSNRFSFKNFWVRRARRILPASLAMMFSTSIAFAFFYPEAFYRNFGKSLSAQSVFSANFFFWRESGYFESAAELKPLLHTWSLAVEEQFYFIFPFTLWLMYKYTKAAILPIVFVSCLASLTLSIMGAFDYPGASFYLLPTRAWELGAGALLGLASPAFFTTNKIINNFASFSGLAMIIYALFTFDKHTPFPSYNAVLPVLGTFALIWANTNTRTTIGYFLSLKPIVGIGLISYSLYLWHWPVIVLSNWLFSPEPSIAYTLILFTVSMILAYLSYKLIETPIRLNRVIFTSKRVIIGSICASILTLSSGLAITFAGNSYLVDQDGSIEHYYQQALEAEPNRSHCSDMSLAPSDEVSCKLLGSPNTTQIDIFIWGDSHASALVPAFTKLAKTSGFNIEYATRNGCQPVLNMRRVDSNFYCAEFNNRTLNQINSSKPKVVVLVGSFVNNISAGIYRSIETEYIINEKKSKQEFKSNIETTLSKIKATGAKTVVFTEPPHLRNDPVNDHLRRQTLNLPNNTIYATKEEHLTRIKEIYNIIDKATPDLRLDYTNFFCTDLQCKVQAESRSLYKDASHISNYGAESLTPLIRGDLESLIK